MSENEYEDDVIVAREKRLLNEGADTREQELVNTISIHEVVNVRGHSLDLSMTYNAGDTDYAIIKSAEAYANFVLEGTVPDDPEGAETGAGEATGGTQETTPEPGTTLE